MILKNMKIKNFIWIHEFKISYKKNYLDIATDIISKFKINHILYKIKKLISIIWLRELKR